MNHIIQRISCQIVLVVEQYIVQRTKFEYYEKHAANSDIFDLEKNESFYSAKELSRLLGLHCSNDIESIAKKLSLKTAKYGKWVNDNSLSNIRRRFYYNKIALTRMKTYLALFSKKIA